MEREIQETKAPRALRFGYLAWAPLVIGIGLPFHVPLERYGPWEKNPWGYMGYSEEGFRDFPVLRIAVGILGSLAAAGLLGRKNWGLWLSCIAGGAALVDACWILLVNGSFMLRMVLAAYEPTEKILRQWISFLSDLALLISWPLLLSAALKADPFGSGNPGMSAAKRRAIFAASIAISLTFFALYRFAYPWFHAG